MAYIPPRKKQRRGRRKAGRRRPKVTRAYTNSLLGASVRPDRLLVKLPYHDTFQLNAPVGLGTSQVMNLNSIYDPDRSGTGHQPLGYDQWSQFYKKYRVFKVAYDITFTNDAGGGTAGTVVAIVNQNGSGVAAGSVGDATFEQPHVRKGVLGNSNSASSRSFKGVVSLPRIAGRPSISYKSDDRYQANFGFNPNEYITMSLIAQSMAGASDVQVQVSVRMVYFVELFDAFYLEMSNTEPEHRYTDPNIGTEKEPSGYKLPPIE